eukprot:9487148-Pyramimonas_sp.AAC.1
MGSSVAWYGLIPAKSSNPSSVAEMPNLLHKACSHPTGESSVTTVIPDWPIVAGGAGHRWGSRERIASRRF